MLKSLIPGSTMLAAMLACGVAAGGDWPQWRGPASQGVSEETGLPAKWGVGENVAWKAALAGSGVSSPVVWGGRVFVTSQQGSAHGGRGSFPRLARDDSSLADRESAIKGARDNGGEVMLVVEAFSAGDGERLWVHKVKAEGEFPDLHEKHNLATPTPVVDAERVYAWFGNGQLVALTHDGKRVWSKHLGKEISPFRNQWGHGSSPALYKGSLILLCDHRLKSYMMALDAKTGEERWRVERGEGRVSHSTPVVVRGPEGEELIVNSSERIDAYDPSNGRLPWYAGSERQTPIPSPVSEGGVLYLSRGYRNSDYLALRVGGRGDVSESHVVWRTAGGASYVPSILLYKGLVYTTNEIGVVSCSDAATGKPLWRTRLGGVFFASPVAGDGKVYLVSETGVTFVLRAGEKPELIAENDLGERFLASPAISGRRIYLRSDSSLFAVQPSAR